MIIKIKDFEYQVIVGIHDFEQHAKRKIVINAQIHTSNEKSRFTNDINDTIDYDKITTKIKNLLSSKRFKLIEGLAQEILEVIMEDKRVNKCVLEVDKIGIIENVKAFSVTLIEERNG